MNRSLLTFTAAMGLLLAPGALAQSEPDPTVNDSDFNETPPDYDESYLDDNGTAEGNATTNDNNTAEPTVNESDFDTTPPPYDESYLEDESTADAPAGDDSRSKTPVTKDTPAPALALTLGLVGLAALATRRP